MLLTEYRPVGFVVLDRWQHPTRGEIAPNFLSAVALVTIIAVWT